MANVPPFQLLANSHGMYDYAYQNMGEVSARPPEKEAATLLICHLREAIPHDTLSRLFPHYEASCARPCTTGSVRGGLPNSYLMGKRLLAIMDTVSQLQKQFVEYTKSLYREVRYDFDGTLDRLPSKCHHLAAILKFL
ncbi:hypothetical protein L6452_19148 [Arctium lappa]|uniref:Uncharacterized protein n=1 Tax=Arctium lappa TaxID=4217 RepID=A0ACB9B8N1_ARCLA|nr:hypothetical protein L6452_19148 [Arctium lappa]